jgi:hypothetical protein
MNIHFQRVRLEMKVTLIKAPFALNKFSGTPRLNYDTGANFIFGTPRVNLTMKTFFIE